ncbi:MAG: hypothetical protein HY934_06745 [Candidatus Firestonebacteria bacterium]|nr:hypothetical protein [Candidatus Firestonebacteria bacterium]
MSIIMISFSILFSVFVAIRPFKIGKIQFDIVTGPLISLFMLFAFKILDFETIKIGIIGKGNIKPWEIIIIFFSVAYVSISTDVTGVFDYLAYRIVNMAKGNKFKLFLFFYLFACVLTTFTSNDIVILTLTPIIFYLGNHSDINVVPLLFAEYFGANTLSMFLYIGNPTNIIVGNALQLGFLEYTKIMWLPTIIATIINFILLSMVFRKQITGEYIIRNNTKFYIRNRAGALLSSFLMLVMLAVLASSQILGIPIWVITLVSAFIFIIEDIAFGIFFTMKENFVLSTELEINKHKLYSIYGIPEQKNEFWMAFKDTPWKILPFIFSVFIFVHGLNQYGVVNWVADIISNSSKTLLNGIILNGILGLILTNIINNQPMTIFLSSVLVSQSFNVPHNIQIGSSYSIIIASNLGANITLVGALAGFMWKNILETKGLKITYTDFLIKGLLITPITFCVTLSVLYFVLSKVK